MEPALLEQRSEYLLLRSAVRISWPVYTRSLTVIHRVGVGFSYADFGETVETTEDAARNVHAFVSIFFETFSQFSGRPLHLSGESYGVRLLPHACALLNQHPIGPIPTFIRKLHL